MSQSSRRIRIAGAAGMILAGISLDLPGQQPPRDPLVHAIAPGDANRRELGRILAACRWRDTSAALAADFILVVVRSSHSHPLASRYDNLKWLRDEAASLAGGPQFHVYSYLARPDQHLEEATHRAYDVIDGQPFADSTQRAQAVIHTRANCPSR